MSLLLITPKIIQFKTRVAQPRNIMQSLSTFIRIPGPIPGVKKSALINYYENIACSEESEQSQV